MSKDLELAMELRSALGDAIPVQLAPTPEIDRVVEHLAEALTAEVDEDASYLEHGDVSPAAMAKLFEAARYLWTVAPWKVASDAHLLRVDAPQLGVEGACLSIVGNLGEAFGFLLFPSLDAWDAFAAAGEQRDEGSLPDFGTSFLSLDFQRGSELPESMRREVDQHGWPVAGPDAFPCPGHFEREGIPSPLTERDVRILAACAGALPSFFVRHERCFRRDRGAPVSESIIDDDDLEVRFTLPYEAFDLFESTPAAGPSAPAGTARGPARQPPLLVGPKVGRNDPCPCGSGRKYKKCHLPGDEASAALERAPVHAADERLVLQMREWADRRFGEAWRRVDDDFVDPDATQSLARPWSVYHFEVDGKSVLDWFLEARGGKLPPAERRWLEAQRDGWLTIWEVVGVEPGRSLTVRDLLTGVERTVHEVSGSRVLVKRDAILARAVTCDDVSVLCGTHPRPLPPMEAAAVVRQMHARLRRKRDIAVAQLRDEAVGRHLIRRWEAAVDDLDRRRAIPPALHNTDGDPLLFTVDRFDVVPGREHEVEALLSEITGVVPPEPDGDDREFHFVKPGNAMHHGLNDTRIGTAVVEAGELRLETNSTNRADVLRRHVEAACAGLVGFREREQTDPHTLLAERSAREIEPPPPTPPEAQRLLLEVKQRHYASWLDERLPALSGKTPREAARTAAGRLRVDVLLKDIENMESRLPAGERFDLTGLRATLGLEP